MMICRERGKELSEFGGSIGTESGIEYKINLVTMAAKNKPVIAGLKSSLPSPRSQPA